MISLLAVGETSEEFFTALLFGSGSWIGLILIMALVLLLALAVKYSSIILVPFQCFLIILYLTEISSSSIAMWSGFLMFCSIILTLIIEVKR